MTRLASVLGAAGSLAATLAGLGCCGAAVLGAAGAGATVGAMLGGLAAGWAPEALAAALGLTLLGLAASARRHRRPWPLVVALAGGGALLAAFHEAWDVSVFAGLVEGGLGLLGAAVALDWWWLRRGPPGRAADRGETCAT